MLNIPSCISRAWSQRGESGF